MTTTTQRSLELCHSQYTTNDTLQSIILNVVDNIIEQDSTDRGALDLVIVKRIALNGFYSEATVTREIQRMLKAGTLYEICYEILDGVYPLVYIRNSDEMKGGDEL